MNESIERFAKDFPWDSDVQRESFLSMFLWLIKKGATSDLLLPYVAAFMFQKDHESSEWIVGVIGDRVRRLEDEIVLLREELRKQNDVVR